MANDPRLRRDGAEFTSVSDAARALGVTPAAIHWHLRRHGHLHRVGVRAKTNAKTYRWQGRDYTGQAAVAAAAGKSVASIQHHLKAYGNLDLLAGAGDRTHSRYLWRGQLYQGQSAVAAAAGVHVNTVGHHLKTNGNLDRLGERQKCPNKSVSVGNEEWPSIKAFAQAVGKSYGRASVVVHAGKAELLQRWVADAGERTQATYIWRGKAFRGMSDVAAAAGVHVSTVWKHLKKYGNLDRLGERDHKIEVTVDWRSWPTVREFAKAVGKSHSRADAVICSGNIDLLRRWVADAGLLAPDPAPQPVCKPAGITAQATFGNITASQGINGEVRLVRMGVVGRHRTASAMFWLKSQVQIALDGAAMRGSQDEKRALHWAMERLADG